VLSSSVTGAIIVTEFSDLADRRQSVGQIGRAAWI
jgi:hypothetical protein